MIIIGTYISFKHIFWDFRATSVIKFHSLVDNSELDIKENARYSRFVERLIKASTILFLAVYSKLSFYNSSSYSIDPF